MDKEDDEIIRHRQTDMASERKLEEEVTQTTPANQNALRALW